MRYRVWLGVNEYHGPTVGYRRCSLCYDADSLPDICALRCSLHIWDAVTYDCETQRYLY